jgi:hypothetical protein
MYLGVSPEETPAILRDDRVGSKEEPVVCGPMLKNMRKHRETPYGWTVVNTCGHASGKNPATYPSR